MGSRIDELYKQFSALPDDDKWSLAAQIFEDLHGPADPGAEEAWLQEIDRRLDQIDRGPVETVPWEKVDEEMTQLVNAKKR